MSTRSAALLAHKPEQMKGGGSDGHQPWLGVVSVGGQQVLGTCSPAFGPPCKYCGEVDGHAAWCPVVS